MASQAIVACPEVAGLWRSLQWLALVQAQTEGQLRLVAFETQKVPESIRQPDVASDRPVIHVYESVDCCRRPVPSSNGAAGKPARRRCAA